MLDEFLNDMKQEHRINELKIELMKAIVGYVTYRMSDILCPSNIISLISIFSGMLQWLLQIFQEQCRQSRVWDNSQDQMLHQDVQ